MNLTEAELTKTTYNGTVMWKINYVNSIARLCDEIGGADVDVITKALAKSYRRIFAPTYWRAGGGDGGPCHPKENAMLSWLSRGANPWSDNMFQRYQYAQWLANKVLSMYEDHIDRHDKDLPIYIVGKGFKAESPIPDHGFPLLMKEFLPEAIFYDKVTGDTPGLFKGVYLIAMNHSFVKHMIFPPGSIIIDPWGMIDNPPENVVYYPVGRR